MPSRLPYLAAALLGLLAIASLSGCEDSFVGTVTVAISSEPLVGTRNVVLAITSIEVGGDGGQTSFVVSPELNVDLDNATNVTLLNALVPAGDYAWVRLKINLADSYVIAANGDRFALDVPDVFQSTAQFVVGEGQTAPMVVHIDLRTALTSQIQGGVTVYTLQPLSQLVNLDAVSDIFGSIPTSLMVGGQSVTDPSCDLQAYVYPGAGAVPEGFFVPVAGGTIPIASSINMVLHTAQNRYTFAVTLVPPGSYTVAVTCAAADVPGSSSIAFSPIQIVVVKPGKNSDVFF